MGSQHQRHELGEQFPGSHAFLSDNPLTRSAVVFVHGFSGSPVYTWVDFPGIAKIQPHAADWQFCDLYFFDYQDITGSIDDSADDLRSFLDEVYPRPTRRLQILCANARRALPTYSKLILVGHSEGGVVIRACIAETAKLMVSGGQPSPILDACVVLFAPALFGFLPTGLLGMLASLFPLSGLLDFVVAGSQAATELRDGITLEQIQRLSEELHVQLPQYSALTAHVIFGTAERIVRKQRYLQDLKYPAEEGKDHSSICKPDIYYQRPLLFVQGACS
jgi:pimeloyl-ACP methyl ester carboxylesterase